MLARRLMLAVLALVVPATVTVPLLARSGPDDAGFPANFSAGVLYATIYRDDIRTYLEVYAPAEAIAAARRGEPTPDGTVLTMLRYSVQFDADGYLVRDAEGYIVRELIGYSVMEKHPGWGDGRPPALRNGDWSYRRYTPNREIDASMAETACLECHKRQEPHDYIFSRARMLAKD
jgi:hypothetical protein